MISSGKIQYIFSRILLTVVTKLTVLFIQSVKKHFKILRIRYAFLLLLREERLNDFTVKKQTKEI